MGFKNIFNKVIEFILGSKLSIELDAYKSDFSFMVDVLINSLKNDNKSNNIGKINKDNFCIFVYLC
ncbi:hypothetical protein EUZ93_04490 [Wolbachia pipientis]|nr:hypothetical protein [Wolbachia pipientis]